MTHTRRELFTAIVGTAAAAGGTLRAATYDDAPATRPALAVLELDHAISTEAAARLHATWTAGLTGTPFEGLRAVVLGPGMRLTLLAEDGTVLNRTIEGAP